MDLQVKFKNSCIGFYIFFHLKGIYVKYCIILNIFKPVLHLKIRWFFNTNFSLSKCHMLPKHYIHELFFSCQFSLSSSPFSHSKFHNIDVVSSIVIFFFDRLISQKEHRHTLQLKCKYTSLHGQISQFMHIFISI